MKFHLTPTEQKIVSTIEKMGKACWVAGGAIRDTLRGVEPKDIDFVTNCCHLKLEKALQKQRLTVIPDTVAKQHGIIRVVDKDNGELIDIARLRKDCRTDGRHAIVEFTDILEEDLARRDFTCNSMAVQINQEGEGSTLIDPYNGQKDVEEHRIRWVGLAVNRIREDYLRLIRMCRFTALWDVCTYELHNYREHAEHIQFLSKERIRDEILKSLMYPKPSNFFRNLHACGLLSFIMPELATTIGVEQNTEHAENVWDHLLRSLDASVELTDNPMLRLAALLHDIGKPPSKTEDEGGIHFYSHEVIGSSIVYEWMREYKFTREQTEYVSSMVRYHMFRFTDESSDKAVKRWLLKVGIDRWRDLITLRMCDSRGNLTKIHKPLITKKMYELMETVQRILDHKEPMSRKDLAINGHDLIEIGLRPGVLFKEITDDLVERVIEDPSLNNKEGLLEYVRGKHGTKED